MQNKKTPLIALAVFSIVILLAQEGVHLVYAVSVSNVVFASGTTTTDVAYDKSSAGSSASTAYIIGQNGGQAYVWKKSATTFTITGNVTLTGSSTAKAIEYNPDNFYVYAVTSDKIFKISTSLGLAGQLATGSASTIIQLYYSEVNGLLYYCYNDGYGTINLNTLALTNLYSDAGTNNIFGCDFDVANNFVYLTGENIGATANLDLIRINLNTNTFVNGVATTNFFYGNCVDTVNHNVWALESSAARVIKYNDALSTAVIVAVGTTPRHCSINTDETGRRLYVANEGTDNISILDIDADTVLATQAVCDTAAGRKLDTARLVNTTNTFVTCNSNTNSVVIDNTVSEYVAPDSTPTGGNQENGVCGNGTALDCVGDRSTINAITGGPSITGVTASLLDGLGIINSTANPDIQTNGTGMLLMLILGTFFATAVIATIGMANTKFGAGISYTEIPKEFWLFLVVGAVGTSWYLGWIPDIIFYAMVIGLAGLFSFGLYKHIRGG